MVIVVIKENSVKTRRTSNKSPSKPGTGGGLFKLTQGIVLHGKAGSTWDGMGLGVLSSLAGGKDRKSQPCQEERRKQPPCAYDKIAQVEDPTERLLGPKSKAWKTVGHEAGL